MTTIATQDLPPTKDRHTVTVELTPNECQALLIAVDTMRDDVRARVNKAAEAAASKIRQAQEKV